MHPSNPPDSAPVDLRTWRIHCDGSALPNPGRMAIGAVLVSPNGKEITLSHTVPGYGCNNEAELHALIAALQAARDRGATAVAVHTDSRVLSDLWADPAAAPIARLSPLVDTARALLGTFDAATVGWIPAHRNGAADALARRALGLPARPQATAGRKR